MPIQKLYKGRHLPVKQEQKELLEQLYDGMEELEEILEESLSTPAGAVSDPKQGKNFVEEEEELG